ncbi:MAG: sulfatase-like hydrolase/transferase [Candidatus Hydrogenedentales bacterium]
MLLCLVLLGGCADVDAPAGFEPPRRVIWLALDSTRTQSMHGFGYEKPTTPWLDEVGKRAVNFEWAIAPSNVTPYSVAQYFTGVQASVLGSPRFPVWVPPDAVTIAELLKGAGFETFMWTANLNLQGNGFERGFDYHNFVSRKSTVLATLDDIIWSVEQDYERTRGPEFIYIHTMDTHYPYRPPLDLEQAFLSDAKGTDAGFGGELHDELGNLVISTAPYFSELHDATEDDIAFLNGLYDGAIRLTDRQLPRLLDALEYSPEHDLLIISSDHGEQFQEHGYWGHNRSMMIEELRVPLMFVYPGFTPRTISEQVSLLDLYPTFCDLYGLQRPRELAGTSLLETLRGNSEPSHAVYAESLEDLTLGATLVTNDYWYWFVGHNKREGWRTWPYAQSLYRYRDDPAGTSNLAEAEPETVEALQTQLATVNPRWAPFTPKLVRSSQESPRLGENVLNEGSLEAAGLIGRVSVGAQPDQPTLVGGVDVVIEANHLPVLEMSYMLTEGIYLVEMVVPETGERRKLWYIGEPRPSGHEHVQTLYDTPERFRLELHVIRPGDLQIASWSLRQLESLLITPAHVGRFSQGTGAADAGRSQEDEERLKALGYL